MFDTKSVSQSDEAVHSSPLTSRRSWLAAARVALLGCAVMIVGVSAQPLAAPPAKKPPMAMTSSTQPKTTAHHKKASSKKATGSKKSSKSKSKKK